MPEKLFLPVTAEPRWGLVVRVKTAWAPGASGAARLTGVWEVEPTCARKPRPERQKEQGRVERWDWDSVLSHEELQHTGASGAVDIPGGGVPRQILWKAPALYKGLGSRIEHSKATCN
jgi:hypothetical protein